MSKYNREAFEAWCESNNIETGRTVTVFEAWAKLQEQRDELLEALKMAKRSLGYASVKLPILNGDYDEAEQAIKKAEA